MAQLRNCDSRYGLVSVALHCAVGAGRYKFRVSRPPTNHPDPAHRAALFEPASDIHCSFEPAQGTAEALLRKVV
jgi:hypothetical protein